MTTTVLFLLIAYQIKHWVCDYPLQGRFMLGKFLPYPDYVMPLFCHALVHFIGTFTIACFVNPDHAVWYATLDGALHFIIDRIKASPDLGGRWKALSANEMRTVLEHMKYFEQFPMSTTTFQTKPQEEKKLKSNKYFWWALGADQMAHHLTHYLIMCLMLGLK